jgi:hypothetical protein
MAAFLSRKPPLHDCSDLVNKRSHIYRSTREVHHHSPRILGSDGADELVLLPREVHSVAVVALRFDLIRRTDEDYSQIRPFGCGGSTGYGAWYVDVFKKS